MVDSTVAQQTAQCASRRSCANLFLGSIVKPFVVPNATRAAPANEAVLTASMELLLKFRVGMRRAARGSSVSGFRDAVNEYERRERDYNSLPESMAHLVNQRRKFGPQTPPDPNQPDALTMADVDDSLASKLVAGLVLQGSAVRSVPCTSSLCLQTQQKRIGILQSQFLTMLQFSMRHYETIIPMDRVVIPLICPSQCAPMV